MSRSEYVQVFSVIFCLYNPDMQKVVVCLSQTKVHGHKYSPPSIVYYIFHIKPHLKKKYFKAISGQMFMKFISRNVEFFEF